jgi:hypothetical protein
MSFVWHDKKNEIFRLTIFAMDAILIFLEFVSIIFLGLDAFEINEDEFFFKKMSYVNMCH